MQHTTKDVLRQDIDLTLLSVKELEDLKKQWWKEAADEGLLKIIYSIGRYLGERLSANYGPKYRYDKDGLNIYVDDYGGYFEATYEGKSVCDTHFCHQKFIRGNWEKVLAPLIPLVNAKIEALNQQHDETVRQKLIKDLS